jgi:hypothetical protein
MKVFLYIVHIFTEVKSVNFLNILILLNQVNLISFTIQDIIFFILTDIMTVFCQYFQLIF